MVAKWFQDDAEIGESKFPKRLSVELKEEKEDGSAVFEVSGSKEEYAHFV